MSVSSAINASLSGLRATQAAMDVVATNVANAGSAGYTRRVATQTEMLANGRSSGVNVTGAERMLDVLVQRQLRLESAGVGYTSVKASYHASLDALFDAPGATNSLPSLVSAFSSSLSALANNPSAYATRAGAVSAAQNLASSLNELSARVQNLRQSTEDALAATVKEANDVLGQIASVSGRMAANPALAGSAGLQDQRDALIDRLSQLLDVKVATSTTGSISIATTGGLQLFDGVRATSLSFDAKAAIGPQSRYDPDPGKRSVGTITAIDVSGRPRDVLDAGAIRSGEIAAYIELRDEVLVQAQTQLDALAAGLASAMSDRTIAGAATASGGAGGFDLDLAGLQNGNAVTVGYSVAGVPRTVTLVKAGSAAAAAAATSSGDGVVGIDFSGGMASVAAQIQAALGSAVAVTSPGGTTLRILDDGAAGTSDVTSLSARQTATGLSTGSPELPLFMDGGALYTGRFEVGSQMTGLAARLAVNPAVLADPASLVAYSASTPAGDTTRPERLIEALSGQVLSFTGRAAIGGTNAAFSGTVADFAKQIVSTQAAGAASARNFDEGQRVVLNAIRSRMSEVSGVNIDTEMTQLIQLQTAYGANARVMSAAKEMLDLLLRVGL